MPNFRLLISDLTEYGDLRCVAGWDLDRGGMVRPEPGPGQFWPSSATGQGAVFAPGNVVVFSATKPNPPTKLPHLNEDRVVTGTPTVEKRLKMAEFAQALGEIGGDAEAVFRKPVEFSTGKAYIPTGTDSPSLYGINIAGSAIEFFENSYNGVSKPRCRVILKGQSVNLSVAAVDLRQLFREKGVKGLQARFPNDRRLHVRIGLARGFASYPNRCYMQVNGIVGL